MDTSQFFPTADSLWNYPGIMFRQRSLSKVALWHEPKEKKKSPCQNM